MGCQVFNLLVSCDKQPNTLSTSQFMELILFSVHKNMQLDLPKFFSKIPFCQSLYHQTFSLWCIICIPLLLVQYISTVLNVMLIETGSAKSRNGMEP